MLAVVLIASLSGAVFSFLFNLGSQREGVERSTGALRGATALLESLEGDALGVIAGDAGSGAGVVGDETTLRLLTRGVTPPMLAAGGAPRDSSILGDLQGVEYRFSEAEGLLTARRWDASGAGDDAPSSGQSSVVATGVSRLRLRYFDGSAWRSRFDSSSDGGLPVAIEVAVWFGSVTAASSADSAAGVPGQGASDPDAAGADGFADSPPIDAQQRSGLLADDAPGDPGGQVLPVPDRVRVIVIPDGPTSAWRDGP